MQTAAAAKTLGELVTERGEQIRRVAERHAGRRAAGILTEREAEEARRFWERADREDRGQARGAKA
jgi:hypothetical protein